MRVCELIPYVITVTQKINPKEIARQSHTWIVGKKSDNAVCGEGWVDSRFQR